MQANRGTCTHETSPRGWQIVRIGPKKRCAES